MNERNCKNGKNTLVVEFIGVTGVGKSTLIAATVQFLSAQGYRVCCAEQAILACYGLAFLRNAKARSALIFLLALPTFGRYVLTREGAQLLRLALGSIGRGMGSLWTGASLLRNFMKRIGSHFLLERLRGEMHDYDMVIWDEGVVHSAHNLFVHAITKPRAEEIEEFGRIVPKPSLLIWVTAPTAQSANVLLRRGHSRVHTTASAARTFAEHAQITFAVLSQVRELEERIFRVDNSVQTSDTGRATLHSRACSIGAFLIRQLHGTQPVLPQIQRPSSLTTPSVRIR